MAIHTGHCAITRQTTEKVPKFDGTPQVVDCLMVLIKQEDEIQFDVRRQFSVGLRETTKEEKIVAETMTELAEELANASEQVTANFIAVRDQVESDEYALAKEELKQRMEELVAEAWEARPDFANAAKVAYGEASQEYIWETLASRHSHRIILKRTPDDQLWLID